VIFFGLRSWNLPTVTEENQKGLQSVQPVFGPGISACCAGVPAQQADMPP